HDLPGLELALVVVGVDEEDALGHVPSAESGDVRRGDGGLAPGVLGAFDVEEVLRTGHVLVHVVEPGWRVRVELAGRPPDRLPADPQISVVWIRSKPLSNPCASPIPWRAGTTLPGPLRR